MGRFQASHAALGGVAVVCALTLAMAAQAPAAAQDATRMLLQVDVPGRANANRHRLAIMTKAPDGRDVMLALSCRVAEPSVLGAVVQFGAREPLPVDGKDVAIRLESPDATLNHRMGASEEFLFMNGREAITVFRQALNSAVVSFDAGSGLTARFALSSDPVRVDRFRTLCNLR